MYSMSPEERFEDLVVRFNDIEGVTPPEGGRGFGRGGLRYHRKIFAMLVRGQLVVKLPEERVGELVEQRHGNRFDANKGTPMREWFALDPGDAMPWTDLASEALEFARTKTLRLAGEPAPPLGTNLKCLPWVTAGSMANGRHGGYVRGSVAVRSWPSRRSSRS